MVFPMPRLLDRPAVWRALIVLGVAWLALGGLAIVGPAQGAGATPAATGPTMVTLTATNALSFAPASVMVSTASVEIEIENVATTDHTFTLSSRVNQTAPASTNASATAPGSYFDAADVLADSVVAQGHTVFVNVTLPAVGAYEFICRYHFPGMVGTLTYNPTSGGGSTSPPYLLYGAIGAVVVVVAVVAVVVATRRRPPAAGAKAPGA